MQHGWSIVKADWEEASEYLQKRSWRKIRLDKHVANKPPPKPGIYLMCTGIPQQKPAESDFIDKIYNVIYVGSTSNLQNRFTQHANGDRPKVTEAQGTFGQLDFVYIELAQSLTELAEGIVGAVFGPVGNDRLPLRVKVGQPEPLHSTRS